MQIIAKEGQYCGLRYFTSFISAYSLNAKEWKVHSFSEWKMFHSKRVNFTQTKMKFHSNKSEILPISLFQEWKFHSFKTEFFTLFRKCSLEPLSRVNKFKFEWSLPEKSEKFTLQRVKFSLLNEWNEWDFTRSRVKSHPFHSFKNEMGEFSLLLEWNFTFVRVKFTLFEWITFHS